MRFGGICGVVVVWYGGGGGGGVLADEGVRK